MTYLVVFAARKHFLAGWSKENGMLILSHVASFHITQRRVRLNYANIAQILQSTEVSRLLASGLIHSKRPSVISLQPSAAKSECSERTSDMRQKLLGRRHAQGYVRSIKRLHIVTAFQVLYNVSSAGGAKCLNRIALAFFHLGHFTTLNDGNTLARMNLVRRDGMSLKVAAALDFMCLAVNLYFVRLHYFLDSLTDIAQTNINACGLDTRFGGLPCGFEEWIELWIERHCPCRVNDSAVNLGSKINFHHALLREPGWVARVGCVVCSDVIQGASSRETNTGVEPSLSDEFTVLVLNQLAHISETNTGLDP
mmetsp:Transcript_2590/g.4296  ORF Transcript_2590/g.4296 Transcript_2590/m.4296 type:complete len:310 (-) Transcript_2590:667-1596(-)